MERRGISEQGCRRRGFGLVDVIVLIMVASLIIIPVMGLIPMGRITVKKAESLQTASFLAQRTINGFRAAIPATLNLAADEDPETVDLHAESTETVNDVTYAITRDVFAIQKSPDPDAPSDRSKDVVTLMDVVVTVRWPDRPIPLVYSSRVYRGYLNLQKDLKTDTSPTPSPGPHACAPSAPPWPETQA